MEHRKDYDRADLVSADEIRDLKALPLHVRESAKIDWIVHMADTDTRRFQNLVRMLNTKERTDLQARLRISLEQSKKGSAKNV